MITYSLLFLLSSVSAGVVTDLPCTEGSVRLLADFSGARAEDCRRTKNGFAVVIRPEAQPINKSPWYAFDIVADEPTKVTVNIRYVYGKHRYDPKRFDEVTGWTLLPENDVHVREDGKFARFVFDVTEPRTRIAAQPLFDPADREAWTKDYAERAGFDLTEAGKTPNDHYVWHMSSPAEKQDAPHLLIIGGQHPPEVPGTIAMRAFLDRLGEDDELTAAFRQQFHIDIFPTLNPDGIAAGHWRFNSQLVDMNRDWGPFEQVETRLVRDLMETRTESGGQPVLMIDFHATFKGDILYTPTGEDGERYQPFLNAWSEGITSRMGGGPGFIVDPRSNPGLPTAKSWFTSTYDAPGVTVELADKTNAVRAQKLGRAAAEELLHILPDYAADITK
ncbi:M14 family zinc carboxypeptidase [Parvularcula marina]|uniref:M14 family zinc carboxypeptidase n=1 Tax=Parvularcula marina TaxID=2292771 RepID=UPI003512E596